METTVIVLTIFCVFLMVMFFLFNWNTTKSIDRLEKENQQLKSELSRYVSQKRYETMKDNIRNQFVKNHKESK